MISATAFNILVGIAVVLAVIGIIKPAWQLTSVAVLLMGVAVLAAKH